MNTKQKGNIGISAATYYYSKEGYTVLIPLTDSQDYDIVIEKHGILHKVQAKYTTAKAKSGNYVVSLRSISGSSREEYKTVKNSDTDLLFICTDDNTMLSVPISQINCVSTLTVTSDLKEKYSRILG